MLDIGWSELLVIGVVALIVVGPKDLPKLFRALGQWVGRARGLARDFQRAMNEAADDSGIGDIKKSFDDATSAKNMGMGDWESSVTGKSGSFKGKPPEKFADSASAKGSEAATAKPEVDKASQSGDADKPAAEKPVAKKKAPAKQSPAKTTPAKKASAEKPAAAKKAPAKKAAAKSSAPKKAAT